MSFSENKITENTLDNQTKDAICQGKLFDLQPIENKRVEVSFTAYDISSDGGLLLISFGLIPRPLAAYLVFAFWG